MTTEEKIAFLMSVGMSRDEAIKVAGTSGADASGSGTIYLSQPKTVSRSTAGPTKEYEAGTTTEIVPGSTMTVEKAIAQFYSNTSEGKKLRDQLTKQLAALGHTNLDTKTLAYTWENLVKQAAAQKSAGYTQTPWDLIPMVVKPNVSGQTTQQYMKNYFTAKGKPTAAANVLLRDALTKVLGRVPSADEIAEYRPILDEMRQKQQAGLFTTNVNNRTGVSTPGIDPEQWLTEQITNKRQARVQYGKETANVSNQNRYVNLAMEYGYNPYNTDGTLSEAARLALSKIESGKMSLEDAQESFKQAALAKYGYLKPQFDAGLTLRQIADPAISAVANILERDPNTITVNDPTVQKYLYGTDGKGTMPMYKYEALLKQDPSWQFTKNARSQFADLAAFIGNKFGMNA